MMKIIAATFLACGHTFVDAYVVDKYLVSDPQLAIAYQQRQHKLRLKAAADRKRRYPQPG